MRRLTLIILVSAAVAGTMLRTPCDAAAKGPKSVPVQMRLAEAMAANEDWDEATRRWIEILWYFGPSEHEARAEFELGAIAIHRGRSDLAVSQWEKAVSLHPDSEWAERARKALKLLGKEPPPPAESPAPYVTKETPPYERQLLIGQNDLAQGLYSFALRDYLKIPNLYPECPGAAEARFRAGTCQALLGRPDLAVEQWQRLLDEYPDSEHARMAGGGIAAWKAVLKTIGAADKSSTDDSGVDWKPFREYASPVDQGLSYAEDLYENGCLDYALQEYAKVLCDIYTPKEASNPHKDYARYRLGVCAYRLRHHDAAARQWRRLIADSPGRPWADRANRALAGVGATDPFSSDASRLAPALPDELPTPLAQRFHLAAQLVDCERPLVAMKEYLKVIFVLSAGEPNPYQAEACYQVGVCQHLLGRTDLARAAWRGVTEDYPDSEWAEKAKAAGAEAQRREAAVSRSYDPAGE